MAGSSRASAARTRPVWLPAGDLPPQHCDLMTQHHDLRVLGRLAAVEQRQPVEDSEHDRWSQYLRQFRGATGSGTALSSLSWKWALDARAARLGMSRSEYVRRLLARDAAAGSTVSLADLTRFAEGFAGLANPDVMARAWR
jgi:hypothetical protein